MAEMKPFITTTQGMSGWFAVHFWWNPEGFWEPWNTGVGRYATEAEAAQEAKSWAKTEEIDYRPRVVKERALTSVYPRSVNPA
jgi:hypothetical protein